MSAKRPVSEMIVGEPIVGEINVGKMNATLIISG
jgi:hypothetical protein